MKNIIFTAILVALALFAYDKFVYKRSFPNSQVPYSPERQASLNKIETISHRGEIVRLEDHIIKGGITIFDFYADWCGPCRKLGPQLENYVSQNANLYLKKINIKDWKTPVVKEYQIQGIPSLWVYNSKGVLIGKNMHSVKEVKNIIEREG